MSPLRFSSWFQFAFRAGCTIAIIGTTIGLLNANTIRLRLADFFEIETVRQERIATTARSLEYDAKQIQSSKNEVASRRDEQSYAIEVDAVRQPKLNMQASNEKGMWPSFEEMHKAYTKNFVDSEGFGISRIRTFDEPSERRIRIEGKPYVVAKVQLIGLMSEKPVVYESSWVNILRKSLEKYEQRAMNDFEKLAVSKLKKGSELVWSFEEIKPPQDSAVLSPFELLQIRTPSSKYELIAPLRASEECISCHDVNKGDLLGAYSYTMHESFRQPVVTGQAVASEQAN